MSRAPSPTMRRRELAARLRQLRLDAGLTIEEVAARLMVSPTKMSRMETAARPASQRDVRDLLNLYGVADRERDRLMTLARLSNQRAWWQQHDLGYSDYIGLEAEALGIDDYESTIIPGLLQTEAYARRVVQGILFDADPSLVEQRVEARLRRQELLKIDHPPTLRIVVDESALRRKVGGAAVMIEQLQNLYDRVGSAAHISLQVIPFSTGAHPGLDSKFIYLHLSEAVPDVVYVESLVGSLYLDTPGDLQRYRQAFDKLREVALSPDQSLEKVAEIIGDLHT